MHSSSVLADMHLIYRHKRLLLYLLNSLPLLQFLVKLSVCQTLSPIVSLRDLEAFETHQHIALIRGYLKAELLQYQMKIARQSICLVSILFNLSSNNFTYMTEGPSLVSLNIDS